MLHDKEIKKIQEQVDLENRERWAILNKKIHSIIDKIAKKDSIKPEAIKRSIVIKLILENKIRPSLTELDISTQEEVIERLEKILHD